MTTANPGSVSVTGVRTDADYFAVVPATDTATVSHRAIRDRAELETSINLRLHLVLNGVEYAPTGRVFVRA